MSDFEFLLSIFGLLLGFTLVELLSGLVMTTKSLRTATSGPATQFRVGWLTPLLALFVILDISSYWVNVWGLRENLTVGFDTVFAGLLIAGGYYFAASMVFPDDTQDWPQLDDWFWLHRKQVLGPLFIISVAWTFILLFSSDRVDGFITNGVSYWAWIVAQSVYFGLLLIAFFARKPFLVKIALGLLSLTYLSVGVGEFVLRFYT